MDGIQDSATFQPHDFNVFQYREPFKDQYARVIQKRIPGKPIDEDELINRHDWDKWLFSSTHTTLKYNDEYHKLLVLLCSRAAAILPGLSSPPSYLPFDLDIWKKVIKSWHVHHGITRVISRRTAYFTGIQHNSGDSSGLNISYFASMSASVLDDLSLSVTFIPKTRSVYSVVYGCNEEQMENIRRRLGGVTDTESQHPLLMVGVLAELDRERLFAAVEKLVDNFTLGSDVMEDSFWSPDSYSGMRTRGNLDICLKSRALVDRMRSVKRQLVKLITHVDKLNEWVKMDDFEGKTPERKASYGSVKRDNLEGEAPASEDYRQQLRITGESIKSRVSDMLNEYEDKIDECKMMEGGLSLAMQTLWSQIAQKDSATNVQIALETKNESIQMRSIALLTMVYVPLSCVASVFSTSLFNFPSGEHIVSSYIWIFFVVSFVVTFITIGIWYGTTIWDKKKFMRSKSFKALEEKQNMNDKTTKGGFSHDRILV